MKLWEFGEIAHVVTWPYRAIFGECCWCKQRRIAWNRYGEACHARWFPRRHKRLVTEWTQQAHATLQAGLGTADALRGRVSATTAACWLDDLCRAGKSPASRSTARNTTVCGE